MENESSLSSLSNISNNEDFKKVVLIGDPSVGKSSILTRFIKNKFSEDIKTTLGVDHYQKRIGKSPNRIKLNIWDTAGQERYRSMAQIYHKGADCVIIVFDLTKRETFDRVDFWRDEILANGKSDVLVVVVGNKSDLMEERQVVREEVERAVGEFGYFYIETSALDNRDCCIEKLFEYVGECLKEGEEGDQMGGIGKKRVQIGFGDVSKQGKCLCKW